MANGAGLRKPFSKTPSVTINCLTLELGEFIISISLVHILKTITCTLINYRTGKINAKMHKIDSYFSFMAAIGVELKAMTAVRC